MSTEALSGRNGTAATATGWRPWTTDLRNARILRYAISTTIATAIAFSINWPLFFLTPVFTAVFLSLPLPGPTWRQTLTNTGYVIVAFALGLVFTLFLMPYAIAYLILLGLVLFHIYYLANRGGPLLLILMCMISVLILPMMGNAHPALAIGFTLYFAGSCMLAMIFSTVAHVLFPDPPREFAVPPRPNVQAGYSRMAAITAVKSTLVLLPLAVLFITFDWTSQVLVLVYAGLFSASPQLTKTRDAGLKSLTATVIGGAVTMVLYFLLIAVPELHFFVPLLFLTYLLFGAGIFSDRPNAKYLGSAATAVIILLSSVMGDDADLTKTLMLRVLLTILATVYVVAALSVLDRFLFRDRR
jgi:hypothetical protein